MNGIAENNNIVKKFRFLDKSIEEISEERLNIDEQAFIEKNLLMKNGVLSFKDSGIFKLSDL